MELRELKRRMFKDCNDKVLFQEMIKDAETNLDSESCIKFKKFSNEKSSVSVQTVFGHLPISKIAENFHVFFSSKFNFEQTDDRNRDEYLDILPKLNNVNISQLKDNINQEEIMKAIDELRSDAAPGLDGITSDFYKKHKLLMTQILEWLWNECSSVGKMPDSTRCGLISLIYKKNDPSLLSNWRPIILSNTDYKIFALIVKNRLSNVLPLLIGDYQTCNIKGRSIYDNLTFLNANINDNVNGAILSIDQESAFDNISHSYLFSVLKAYNFPDEFINIVKVLYKESYVHVNFGLGFTNEIPVNEGVKQGDPMASSLYVLCFEPLLLNLSSKLREISISPFSSFPDTNLSAYADDTACILSHDVQFPVVQTEFSVFGKFSGSKINKLKSELYLLGNWTSRIIDTEYKIVND